MALQLLGFVLGTLGFFGTLATTLLPHWRISAYVGSNIITSVSYMRGLWMECVWHSTGIYQCVLHRSLLALPPDLQAARALMVLSCVGSMLAILLAVMGMRYTQGACRGSSAKKALLLGGGFGFFCAGLLCLVTLAWTTHSIIHDFFLLGGMKYEMGLAIYVGYASCCLSLTGGLVLCCNANGHQQPVRNQRPVRNQQTVRHHLRRPPTATGFSSAPPPPPAAFAPAPSYKRPEAIRGNCVPSCLAVSSSGYRLDGYF